MYCNGKKAWHLARKPSYFAGIVYFTCSFSPFSPKVSYIALLWGSVRIPWIWFNFVNKSSALALLSGSWHEDAQSVTFLACDLSVDSVSPPTPHNKFAWNKIATITFKKSKSIVTILGKRNTELRLIDWVSWPDVYQDDT